MKNKPRVVKDYEKVGDDVIEQIKLEYPYGFEKYLITFKNAKNEFVSALPFETEDRYYLIRMTRDEARDIILEDEDYDDDGNLRDEVKDEYMEKYDIDEEMDEDEIEPSAEDIKKLEEDED